MRGPVLGRAVAFLAMALPGDQRADGALRGLQQLKAGQALSCLLATAKPGDEPPALMRAAGALGDASTVSFLQSILATAQETYVKDGWLRLCSEYGKTEQCAAVVPQRGDDCLWNRTNSRILSPGPARPGPALDPHG